MNVGITGANGHVGANLVRRLLKENFKIRVLQYRDHEGFDGLEVEVVTGDLNDSESLVRFCDNMDVVIHLAAKISIGHNTYEDLYKTNVEGTRNLAKISKKAGVKRFIHFSTIDALEHKPLDEPMDESRPLRKNSDIAYEKTKSLAEEWITQQQGPGFDVIILNPTAIFGPYDYKPSLLGQVIMQIYNGTLPGLIPGGYNWVDIRDVCEAARNAIYQGRGGERYLLSGHYKSVIDLAKLVHEITDKKMKIPILPLWLAYAGTPLIYIWSKLSNQKPVYTKHSLDILQAGNKNILNEKARRELGFNPRPLADSLKDTLNWFNEYNYLSK
jgi:dihydroflavonol-4-reductase